MTKPLWRCVNRILQRLLPKTWDRAVHRVATERGLTDAEVRARLDPPPPRGMRGQQTVASAVVPPRPKTPPEPPPVSSGAPRNPYPGLFRASQAPTVKAEAASTTGATRR